MPFILGEDRNQISLLPNTLDDYVSEDNPVRVIDAYVDSLNLEELGFVVYTEKALVKDLTEDTIFLNYIFTVI